MKNYSFLLIVFILLTSCRTTKYKSEWGNNFLEVKAGSVYHFKTFSNEDFKMEVTNIQQDSIFGVRRKENVVLSKKNIRLVKKDSPFGTAALIAGVGGTIAILWIGTKAISDIGRGLGNQYSAED